MVNYHILYRAERVDIQSASQNSNIHEVFP